jgi:hypothetical protein
VNEPPRPSLTVTLMLKLLTSAARGVQVRSPVVAFMVSGSELPLAGAGVTVPRE